MKKIITLLFVLILSGAVSAQTVFWTEGFGKGCNQDTMANGHITSNGMWTVAQTGINETDANVWYISGRSNGTGRGNCDSYNCSLGSSTSNQTLHVSSNDGVEANDDHCDYDDGALCSFLSICTATNSRAQSPAISTLGYSGITLSFNYIEYGQSGEDYASLYYSPDSGVTWTALVNPLPQTPCCGGPCTGNSTNYSNPGQWTRYTVALPASCNNNPKVMIGFNWTNDDMGNGFDPSISVDSIELSVPTAVAPPVANFQTKDTTICANACIDFTNLSTNATAWNWYFPGATDSISTLQSPTFICYQNSGTYNVTLIASNSGGSDTVTISHCVTVIAAPPTPSISQGHDTLYCSSNPAYISYQWFVSSDTIHGATNSYLLIDSSGDYNVSVTNANHCSISAGINVTFGVGIPTYISNNKVSIFPNPSTDEINLTGNWQSANGLLSIYNVLGEKVRDENIKLNDRVIIYVKDLSTGIYFLQIVNEQGRWTGRFAKD